MAQPKDDDKDNVKGDHPGYEGPGTFILKDGARIAVDPVTLEPLPKEDQAPAEAPAPEPIAEKTKPAAKPADKPAADASKTESNTNKTE
jgi:hypothetical protein